MKHMSANFSKQDKFERMDFRRCQKKMQFFLLSMSVVYVLSTPIPKDGGDDATVEQIRHRKTWENVDYLCGGLIINGTSLINSFFKHSFKHKKKELTLVDLGLTTSDPLLP